ncbi:unnamed protein product, partial [Cochlearia groenlandica]
LVITTLNDLSTICFHYFNDKFLPLFFHQCRIKQFASFKSTIDMSFHEDNCHQTCESGNSGEDGGANTSTSGEDSQVNTPTSVEDGEVNTSTSGEDGEVNTSTSGEEDGGDRDRNRKTNMIKI